MKDIISSLQTLKEQRKSKLMETPIDELFSLKPQDWEIPTTSRWYKSAQKALQNIHTIPKNFQEDMLNYYFYGEIVNNCLSAILESNLPEMKRLITQEELSKLDTIINYLSVDAPTHYWGSMSVVRNWKDLGGLAGWVKVKETHRL